MLIPRILSLIHYLTRIAWKRLPVSPPPYCLCCGHPYMGGGVHRNSATAALSLRLTTQLPVHFLKKGCVLAWAHMSHFACHPGAFSVMNLIKRHFVWSNMDHMTPENVSPGLLHPQTVPEHPWYHITLDVSRDLPPSQGNTVIFTIVDGFLKQFILWLCLNSPPSSKKTPKQKKYQPIFWYSKCSVCIC